MKMRNCFVACALLLSTTARVGAGEFQFIASSTAAGYDVESGSGAVEVTLDVLQTDADSAPVDTQGFSMGISYDGNVLEAIDADITAPVRLLNNGLGPTFSGINLDPAGGPGITVGVVYSFTSGASLEFADQTAVIELTFETVEEALAGDEDGRDTLLAWDNTLGAPPVENIVVVDGGESMLPEFIDGAVSLRPQAIERFRRADPNGDGFTDIADAVWLLNWMFADGAQGTCRGSDDANGDGSVDTSDAVFILYFRFLHGPQPPTPFGACGFPAGREECAKYAPCR